MQILLSILLYATFVVSLFLGLYSLSMSKSSALNRVFFLVCLSIAIWSFAFSVGNNAETLESAIFWRRISSFGWGVFYSILLHFIFLLTDNKKILQNKWIMRLIYLPALFNVLFYGLYSKTALVQYHLTKTVAGWASISTNSFGDTYFNIYYLVFSILVMTILYSWGRHSQEINQRKKAYLLIGSVVISLLLGTFSDVLANRFLSTLIPSISPIFIIIPLVTIFLITKKFNFMNDKIVDATPKSGMILSDAKRIDFYKYLSMIYASGSFFNLMYYFSYLDDFDHILIFSGLIALMGSVIFMVLSTVS